MAQAHTKRRGRTFYEPFEEVGMSEWTREQRRWLRGGIAVLAVTPALVGLWATVSPRGFFDDFPGAGHHWVSTVSVYDEHLVRDVGALYLGSLVLLGFAWVWLERRLVQAALVSYTVAALPHLVYHLTTLDGFSTGDAVVEIAGLALNVALPLWLLSLTRRAGALPQRAAPTASADAV
jgi:cellulose synthase/poly-beta-1,6-N-acetylglucosamine synthase-like glycosyltransferase